MTQPRVNTLEYSTTSCETSKARICEISLGNAYLREADKRKFDYADLLRERILDGEKADIFIADDLHNPTALMQASKSSPVVNFVNNRICAIANALFADMQYKHDREWILNVG